MKKLLVLYYSRSGNTEKMAKALAEGAQSGGNIEVELNYHIETPDLANFDAIAIGAPTYRNEMPIDFKTLFEEVEAKGINLKGKLGAAFGSYGWSGEAPKKVLDILKEKFGMVTLEPPLLAKYAPDAAALESCRGLGKKISETLKNTA
ncbi:MAG: flavodoxin domain-containing protein [Candidatus Bathyarchaeota archaeon]|nr:flavodoxin domain-containing protein [Candidatus Bathyarchaeota archaeon]